MPTAVGVGMAAPRADRREMHRDLTYNGPGKKTGENGTDTFGDVGALLGTLGHGEFSALARNKEAVS